MRENIGEIWGVTRSLWKERRVCRPSLSGRRGGMPIRSLEKEREECRPGLSRRGDRSADPVLQEGET